MTAKQRITKRRASQADVLEALRLYQEDHLTSQEIADKFKVSPGALTGWAKKYGVPLRQRGRPIAEEPSDKDMRILVALETMSPVAVARRYNLSRQHVHQVRDRWLRRFHQRAQKSPNPVKPPTTGSRKPRSLKENKDHVVSMRLSKTHVRQLLARRPSAKSAGEAASQVVHWFLSLT